MSSVNQAIISLIQALGDADRKAILQTLNSTGVATVPVATVPVAPVAADKKPRANKGKATLHGAWTAHILKQYPVDSAEFKAFLAQRIADAEAGKLLYNATQSMVKSGKKAVGDRMDAKEATSGAHIAFVSHWKSAHSDVHTAFKTKWELENKNAPLGSSSEDTDDAVTVVEEPVQTSSITGSITDAKKRGPKKHADMTPDELKAEKEKRAAKKAAKAATPQSRSPSPKVKDE